LTGADDTSFYLQQHQQGLQQASLQQGTGLQQAGLQQTGLQQTAGLQQNNFQDDLRLRAQQLLLQEHLDRQREDQQFRAMSEQLNDFPDLQQHYNRMLLSEQLMQQEERAYLQERVAAQQAAATQAAQSRYQEEQVRLHQLRLEDQSQTSQTESSYAAYQQQHYQLQQQQLQEQKQQLQQMQQQQVPSASTFQVQSSAAASLQALVQPCASDVSSLPSAEAVPKKRKKSASKKSAAQRKRSSSKESLDLGEPPPKRPASGNKKPKGKRKATLKRADPSSGKSMEETPRWTATSALEKVALAADMATPQIVIRGTVQGLLEAARGEEKVDEVADIMCSLKAVDWSDSESDDEVQLKVAEEEEIVASGLRVPTEPAESIILPTFKSSVPKLPEEPLYDELEIEEQLEGTAFEDAHGRNCMIQDEKSPARADADLLTNLSMPIDTRPKKVSNVLDYPFPVDTWWPSSTGIRRERHAAGETSDEEKFEEEPCCEHQPYRADATKIRIRLATKSEPGVLEKLPHCKIHRFRTKRKKNSTAPELVYCWQVTEIYPNEIMVDCSGCGTWRHAACGGHHEPYSTRENTKKPFVGLCDFCKEEETFLEENPQGKQRMERQRLEQLRRGMATSAVMRHSSYSKHGGTYKWPLGSVSATHIGGHTRSVHARHDKAEKQWTDMATRLGRGYGYRPKERTRVRTKELERLLVSVEDAEIYTDRHNMLLFLMRDTTKEHPVGFEGQRRNIFDPAEDEHLHDEDASGNGDLNPSPTNSLKEIPTEEVGQDGKVEETLSQICARTGCCAKPRFDSMFCSDSCGISVFETDLLRTFQDASDIHPSVLRH